MLKFRGQEREKIRAINKNLTMNYSWQEIMKNVSSHGGIIRRIKYAQISILNSY